MMRAYPGFSYAGPVQGFQPLPAQVDLPALEHEVLTRWQDAGIFERSLEQTAGGPAQAIKDLITRKEKQGNWTFVFLGADLSAFAVGDAMGVNLSNSVTYDTTNVHAAYANTACATMAFSSSPVGQTADFYKSVPMRRMVAAGMSRRLNPKMRTR